MVGRLIKSKHFDRLIKIFMQINEPNWQLVIVGYDHLKQNNMEYLRQLIKESGAEDKVILKGKIKSVDEYYLKSKIFAFTSSSEGFPNAIGEALSAGIPVVAYDSSAGPSDLIHNNKNGYLVKLFDDEDFKSKLENLMKNEDLQIKLGSNAKQSIKKFHIDKIGELYLNFITKTL